MSFSSLVSYVLATSFLSIDSSNAHRHTHHRRQNGGGSIPLIVSNQCADTVWPGILSQGGPGPSTGGFQLSPGSKQTLSVGSDWQGRVWGRTNCSFNGQGQSAGGSGTCSTGDCGGALSCVIAGAAPATLAEFTLQGSQQQTFYDLSLVDGYNLPMAIVLIPNGVSTLQSLDASSTNPSCVASVGDLAAPGWSPYGSGQQFLGTSGNDPLPFDQSTTLSDVASWCPWDLQVNTPTAPGNGVYPYPDGNVQRPVFDPCLSACAKYDQASYCCTGNYDSPGNCGPNYYSKAAKSVCPDAYSYAYDDKTSTFIIAQGGGFQVVFCPGGRSTNILATKGSQGSGNNAPSGDQSFSLRVGRFKIEGRVVKTALAGLFVVVFALMT